MKIDKINYLDFKKNSKDIMAVFKPLDILLYGFVILIMAGGFLYFHFVFVEGGPRVVLIEMDGTLLQSVNLTENMESYRFNILTEDEGELTVLVGYESTEIIKSTCPDQVCVRWGKIYHSGQSVVCLPFRVMVRIVGQNENDELDDVTW